LQEKKSKKGSNLKNQETQKSIKAREKERERKWRDKHG
jgi:hypothetical protein